MPTTSLGLSRQETQIDVLAQLVSILAKLNATLSVGLDAPTLAALENVSVQNLPATYNTRTSSFVTDSVTSRDKYTDGEVLADQVGAGGVLTFTFASPVDLVFVHGKSAAGNLTLRADPFGGVPSVTQGIPSDDGSPLPLPITTGSVQVYAPNNMTISVWGYRYA